MSNLISRIELVSQPKKIYRVLFDNDYQIELVEDTLLNFNLAKGSSIPEDTLHAVQHYDAVMRCVYQAYRFLSRRPHLEAEIKRKLLQKMHDKIHVEQAIQKLKKQGYLNDIEFIQLFIKEESTRKKTGPLLIRKKLFERGANPEEVDLLISSEYPDERILKNALQLWLDYKAKKTNDSKKMLQNGIRFLQQKGYTYDLIQEVREATISTLNDQNNLE
jgi:regulatory protein